jgi:malonate transporter
LAAFAAFALYVLIAGLIWRRPYAELVIGALGSGYVNSNNIGIPVAAYVLGDAAFSAPVLLLQLLVITPIALTLLDIQEHRRASVGRILLGPVKNPIIIGSALGVIVAFTGVQVPDWVMDPFRMVGAAAVPVVLLAFGISLHGQRPLHPGTDRRGVLLATTIKLGIMPMIAWLLGRFMFGIEDHLLFGLVVLAALPSAHLVFNYAQRYNRGVILARDIVLLTTAGCIPVLVLVAALLSA